MIAFIPFLTSLLMIYSMLSSGKSDDCPALYKRFCENPTFCLPPNNSCNILAKGVGAGQIKVILDAHNEYRSKIAMGEETKVNIPSSSDMLKMKWDKELASIAQNHAEQCLYEHDSGECRQVENFSVGQNIAGSWYSQKGVTKPNWKSGISDWYNEVKDFNSKIVPAYDKSKASGTIGHFTQVVWSRSWKVGCGFAAYPDAKGGTTHLYICNYGSAGNMRKDYVYKEGKPCSSCPTNSCCSGSCGGKRSFPGLCRVTPGKRPEYSPVSSDFLFFCDFTQSCKVRTPSGMPAWKIIPALSGPYAGIVLKAGESSSLEFAPTIPPHPKICWSIRYRKGLNMAGQKVAGLASVVSNWLDIKQKRPRELSTQEGTGFTTFKFTTSYNMKLKLSLKFEVPSGAPEQYFEVTQFFVKKDKC